jgi:DNA segregation ATPase FtsK/SpoIIIE-like protein
MDSRGPEQDIVNAFAVDSLFERPARIKTLLVLQESEITDSRMTNALSRLDKLGKLLTDPRQLRDSLSLVVTKGDGEFEPVDMLKDVMQTMINEKLNIHPLIRFFGERPDLVFSLPKPPRSADGKEYNPLFRDRERIIRNLQTHAVENPIHAINLDDRSIVYVTGLMSRIENVDELIGSFASAMQDEYRTKQLEDLRNWSGFIEKLSGLRDDEIDRPEKLVSFLGTIPSNPEKFQGVIDRIASTRRIFCFLEKVCRDKLKGTITLKTIPEVLRPLLKNIRAELHEMIQSKELIEEQKRKTQEIEEELKKQQEEADRKEKEQKKQMEDLEARAKQETSQLQGQLEEEVKAGKLAREEAEKRLKEYEAKSAEEIKKARQASEAKITELQETVKQEQANASRAVEQMRQEIAQKESQTEQRIRQIQESSREAAEESRRQAQEQMAIMENRVREAENRLQETRESSSYGGGQIGWVFIPGCGWVLVTL